MKPLYSLPKRAFLLLFFSSTAVFSQWTNNPKPANPITAASGLQIDAKFSSDNDGNTYYVWKDLRNNTNELYAQKLNILGVVQWGKDGVRVGTLAETSSTAIRFSPKTIKPDGKGGALVLWHRYDNPQNLQEAVVVFQHIQASGNTQWSKEIKISDETHYSQDENFEVVESAFATSTNSYHVLFNHHSVTTPDLQKFVLKEINTNGEVQKSTILAENVAEPKGLMDEKNKHAIIYYKTGATAYVERHSFSGEKLSKTLVFTSSNANRIDQFKIETDNSVVFGRTESGGGISNVFAHKISLDGISVWKESGIQLGDNTAFDLQLVASNDNTAVGTWISEGQPRRFLSAKFRNDGGKVWEREVTSATSPNKFFPNKLVSDGENGFFTLWFSEAQSGYNLTLQRIDKNGSEQFGSSGKIMEGWDTFTDYRLLSHPKTGCIVIFGSTLNNSSSFDLFTNRLNNDGTYGIKNTISVLPHLKKSYSVGESFNPNFTTEGDGFLEDNIFTAELLTPRQELIQAIGEGKQQALSAKIPTTLQTGIYLIRVLSSSPKVISNLTEINIIAKPAPPVLSTEATKVCAGTTITISATGCEGGIITWSNGTKGNTLSTVIQQTSSFTAICDVNSLQSDISTAITLTSLELPNATANNSGPYVEGKIIQLSASGGDAYQWSGPNGFASSLQSPTINNAAVNASGSYEVVVSKNYDGTVCSKTANTNVVVTAVLASENPTTIQTIIFPNPSSDFITIEVEETQLTPIFIQLLDMLGHELKQRNIVSDGTKQRIEFNVNNYPSGSYLVKVGTPRGSKTTKISISK